MAEKTNEETAQNSTESKPTPKSKRKRSPLTVEEFKDVLEKAKSLGIVWTPEIPPRIKFEKQESEEISQELMGLMRLFPNFPLELASVIYYVLTGNSIFNSGSKELRDQKAEIVRELGIIDDKYRSEFFFRHATKVPYFSDVDWEVVIKEYERGVEGTPSVSYALLSLRLDTPRGAIESTTRTITVAVNQQLTEELIATLTDVLHALQKSKVAAATLDEAKAKGDT
jgi:hypothetical protein